MEGASTWIPVQQVQKADPPSSVIPLGSKPLPPLITGIAREVSALPEGEAMLQWPSALSAESVGELEDWLELVVKKLKRRYGVDGK